MDIVRFKGGLGNQMFQYAFIEALRHMGREVYASLGVYNRKGINRKFVLEEVFPDVRIAEIEDNIFKEIDLRWQNIKKDPGTLAIFKKNLQERFFYVEEQDSRFDNKVFDTLNCTFVGYWQTEKYFENIKREIKRIYSFHIRNNKLQEFAEKLHDNFFSVHIRYGDYLNMPFKKMYGGICTKEYYQKAMKYINDRVACAKFIIFSDETSQVSTWFEESESIVLFDKSKFEDYEDWYDMYLMTRCRGNIIANSSFSWWAAWLNECTDQIVIAPKVWLNEQDTPDIWCANWIRL